VHLSLSEVQQHIVESAENFLSSASGMANVREVSQGDSGLDLDLWSGISELGWCGVHLPEAVGGLGLGMVELTLLQEQMGRRLACVPFFDSVVLAATLLRELMPEDAKQIGYQLLCELGRGETMASLAWKTDADQVQALRTDAGWLLSGIWCPIGSAATADALLLSAADDCGVLHLFSVPADSPGVQVQPLKTLDPTRRSARVVCQGVSLPSAFVLAEGLRLTTALERTQSLGAIALAAEQVGVAQQCLDITLAYTTERHQFDRPVASFQAVKHRCAQMLVAVESARSAVYGAAALADAAPDLAALQFHAAQARVAATEAANYCAREAIQLHGGVGFTWEYDPHFYLRRAQASSQRLEPTSRWLEWVAAVLLDKQEKSV